LEVNTSLLRYWEKEFGMLRPKRTSKGDRLYTKDDIAKVREIQVLLKDKGFTIQGAKDQLRSARGQTDSVPELVERLRRVRSELLVLRTEISEAEEVMVPSYSS
jgi:DNA-binding transcriptional MerR regulator